MRTATPPQITSAGTNMFPVLRITLAKPFMTHNSTMPPNTTFE